MAEEQFQYVKLPDGSMGKFLASAKDADIRSAIEKDFPDAYKPAVPAPAEKPAVPDKFTMERFWNSLLTGNPKGSQSGDSFGVKILSDPEVQYKPNPGDTGNVLSRFVENTTGKAFEKTQKFVDENLPAEVRLIGDLAAAVFNPAGVVPVGTSSKLADLVAKAARTKTGQAAIKAGKNAAKGAAYGAGGGGSLLGLWKLLTQE